MCNSYLQAEEKDLNEKEKGKKKDWLLWMQTSLWLCCCPFHLCCQDTLSFSGVSNDPAAIFSTLSLPTAFQVI